MMAMERTHLHGSRIRKNTPPCQVSRPADGGSVSGLPITRPQLEKLGRTHNNFPEALSERLSDLALFELNKRPNFRFAGHTSEASRLRPLLTAQGGLHSPYVCQS